MPDSITITPEIWRLRRMHVNKHGEFDFSDDRYGTTGIYFDGQYATVTDGSCLLAVPHVGPKMPATWRVLCLYPGNLGKALDVPLALGWHAAEGCLVKIYDAGQDFPNWRLVVPRGRSGRFALSAKILRRFLEASGLADEAYVSIDVDPESLAPIMFHRDSTEPDRRIAIIMPCRKE